jgi:MoaD family protein
MTVTFLGYISRIAGIRQQALDASTVENLLDTLLRIHGTPWREHVFDGHSLVNGVVVMVNGTNVSRLRGLSTRLSSGDEVVLLPQFEGG